MTRKLVEALLEIEETNREQLRSEPREVGLSVLRRTAGAGEGIAWSMSLLHEEGLLEASGEQDLSNAIRLLRVAYRTALLCDSAFAEGIDSARNAAAALLEQTKTR